MDCYKKYRVKLLMLSPVHIGNGHVYSQKEYIYENRQYYFVEIGKVYTWLIKNKPQKITAFEKFIASTDPRKSRLLDFLKSEQIEERAFGGYVISETGYETEKKGRLNQVVAFTKNCFGEPYIPGSSLKGVLRTILVNECFKKDPTLKNVENQVFNAIRVSDSKPIDKKKLILVQKWDFNAKKKRVSALPIYRESLCPGTMVEFTVTAVGDEAVKLIDNLMIYAENFYQKYTNQFLKDFPDCYIQDNIKGYAPVYLGAGSGLWTKVDYKNVDIAKIRERSSWKMKMKGNGAFKLTKASSKILKTKADKTIALLKKDNKDNLYEMGKCGIKISKL